MEIKYPVALPDLSGNESKYVNEVLASGIISSKSPFVEKLETQFAEKHDALYGVASSSGTNALILALRALGIREGDEVIVPEFTMVATAWAVNVAGGKPVFADCDGVLKLKPEKIEEIITPKTRAIVITHIYGRVENMEKILELAHEYNLPVIEDACEAHGTPLRGTISCFSFYGNKILTAGEGGMCITNSKELSDQMKHLRGMAFNADHSFIHKKIAYNFRMTGLQAAVALAQLERLGEFLAKRKQIETWYNRELEPLKGRSIFDLMPERQSVWVYDVLAGPFLREELRKFLADAGIETRVFFKPMSQQPMYFSPMFQTLYAYKRSLEGFYLPVYTQMTEEDVVFIAGKIKEFYASKENKESVQGKGGSDAQGASFPKGPSA